MGTVRIPFEVTGWEPDPQTAAEQEAVRLGRITLRKAFRGPLTGTSVVAMSSVAVGDAPAGYVAVELVTGTLEGRTGAFALEHTGVVEGGADPAGVVVPGTGTGELAGLRGTMTITHDDGAATLVLDYELP
jgi:Protein of unknown function (DUF3224)